MCRYSLVLDCICFFVSDLHDENELQDQAYVVYNLNRPREKYNILYKWQNL